MQHIEFALDNHEIPETYQISKEFTLYVETMIWAFVDCQWKTDDPRLSGYVYEQYQSNPKRDMWIIAGLISILLTL